MIPNTHVQYSSLKAAEDIFLAIQIDNTSINFSGVHYIDEETAAANLEIARLRYALINPEYLYTLS